MHTVRFGHLFSGKVGCTLNWPLPQRKAVVIFRDYFALNPSSLYLGSCLFGLWLPSTPQFGEYMISLLITTSVILIMLKFFEVLKDILDSAPSK